MSDEETDAVDEQAEWKNHPAARAWVRSFASERDQSLKALLGAAAKSTDPDVRGAYQQFNEREVRLRWLTAAPK